MKRLLFCVFYLFLSFSMLGCDNLGFGRTLFTTTTSDQIPTTTSTEPDIYVEMEPGQLQALMDRMQIFDYKFMAMPKLIINSETLTTVHYPNYSRVSDSSYDLEIDFEDFYIFASELPVGSFHPTIEYLFEEDGKIHRFTRDGENRIIRRIALSEITEDNLSNLLKNYGFSEDGSMDYYGNVVQKTQYRYEAQVGFPYWEKMLGIEFVNFVKTIDEVRYNQLYLDVVIRFNGDYSGYVMDISLEVTGKMNNKTFGIEVMITQSVKVSNFAKKTVAEMGFNVPVGTTWEDIEFDATTNLMEFWISPQQGNWIRYYLQPGVYQLNMDKSAYRAYNEAMEELPFIDTYVTIDNAGYYYINLLYLGSERVSIGLVNLGISDITYEIISNPVDGTIIGYSEGENDINKFFFSIKDKSYILVLDLSNSLLSVSNISIIPTPNCGYELVFCPFLLRTTYDTMITIRTKVPGSFQIDYRFIEYASTSQEPTNLVDISMYDEKNPIYVGDGITYAYFLITIDHYGKYAVHMKRIFGSTGLTSDIYRLDGTKIEMVGLNWFNLDEGTYIVKQYFKYNQEFCVYYPYLHEYD